VMNERLLNDVKPPRDLNPEISPELQEILYRALEREPRHRYATASEMMWDLEHQEQVGVEQRGARPTGHVNKSSQSRNKLLLYGVLVVVPILLFAVMLLLARR
jgi:eukaryotic-like serine/threonine-protein kinase